MLASATKTMTVQATNKSSERIFSKGGCEITYRKLSLTNEHTSQLIFFNYN